MCQPSARARTLNYNAILLHYQFSDVTKRTSNQISKEKRGKSSPIFQLLGSFIQASRVHFICLYPDKIFSFVQMIDVQ